MTTLVIAEGLPALLKCHIRGDHPIQVMWKKNSIVLKEDGRVIPTVSGSNSTVVDAQLKIQASERSDSGIYICVGSNLYGRDEAQINLQVRGLLYLLAKHWAYRTVLYF